MSEEKDGGHTMHGIETESGRGALPTPTDRWFTVVFPGAIESYNGNPYLADTPFGRAQCIGSGDIVAERDEFQSRLYDLWEAADALLAECEQGLSPSNGAVNRLQHAADLAKDHI